MREKGTYDENLIAACGLYCGNCKKYLSEKCPGCKENTKASWCEVRSCCQEKGIANCSACDVFANLKDCKKHNNPIARLIGFVTSSDRAKCISLIRENGTVDFVKLMCEKGWVSIPRKFDA